jgi:5-methylcytosine-specific restriction protein A
MHRSASRASRQDNSSWRRCAVDQGADPCSTAFLFMPTRPKRPCPQPGCPALTDGGRCVQHARESRRRVDAVRGTASSRGYGKAWEKARLGHLAHEPLCRLCAKEGRTTAANTVDHIIPHRGDRVLFWDRKNWQSLCQTCSSTKTAKQDGGFGNRRHHSIEHRIEGASAE